MRETTPRIQRVYLKFTDVGGGVMKLAASLIPPTYDDPMLVVLSRGVLPLGQPLSLTLVSDPSQNQALRGPAGKDGKDGINGTDGANGVDGTNGTNGSNGVDGLSAYQLARQAGYGGTLTQWLTTLIGAPGKDGANGKNGTNGVDGKNASALLGTVTVGQTATIAIAAGVRRISITIPATFGVATGDPLILCPTTALAGYAIHDVVAVSTTSLSVGLTGPLLAIGASFSIPCKLLRLNV